MRNGGAANQDISIRPFHSSKPLVPKRLSALRSGIRLGEARGLRHGFFRQNTVALNAARRF